MTGPNFVYCSRCGLKQFGRPRCLRCDANLAQPDLPALVAAMQAALVAGLNDVKAELAAVRQECAAPRRAATPPNDANWPSIPTLIEAERELIRAAMAKTYGNRIRAAKILGIGKTTMYRKVKELGLAGTGATR